MKGVPGQPTTGPSGRFVAVVKEGGSASIVPEKLGYRFRPDKRSYVDLDSDRGGQLFTGYLRERDVGYYAQKTWWGVARVAYHVVPSLQFFWVADQLMRPEPYIPLNYVGRALLYASTWCAAMIALGAFLFEGREII